jgi:Rrf2 family protein
MRMTMKGDYGLRAMIDLAAHFGKGPVPSSEIAARQLVPEHFLDQLLITLRRAGLLKSQRGPQGGHMLARPPDQISMSDVVEALEGDTSSLACVPNPAACQISAGCGMRDVWVEIEQHAQQVLASTTLEQLAQRHRGIEEEGEVMYYI